MSAAHRFLRRFFVEPDSAPARARRLDVDALRSAARAAGFENELEAVRVALDTRNANISAIDAVLSGATPASLTRWRIASLLQVSERDLWPVDEREVH